MLFCADIKADEIILSHALRAATSLERGTAIFHSIKQCRNGISFLNIERKWTEFEIWDFVSNQK